jgi:hypothetical protein
MKEIRDIFWPQAERDKYCDQFQGDSDEDPYIRESRAEERKSARESELPIDWPEYEETNREKKLEPKLGYWYCKCCDKQLVGDLGKCQVCGKKPEKRTIKIKVKKK